MNSHAEWVLPYRIFGKCRSNLLRIELIPSFRLASKHGANACTEYSSHGHFHRRSASKILSGNDTAATEYFKRQSSTELTTAFAPIVHRSMENVGVVKQYNQLMQNPAASRLAESQNFNLDKYVVGKTLDGLFYVMGEEERKIRKDPAAQTTALLREIFGKKQ